MLFGIAFQSKISHQPSHFIDICPLKSVGSFPRILCSWKNVLQFSGESHRVGERIEDDTDGFGDGVAGCNMEFYGDDEVGIGK